MRTLLTRTLLVLVVAVLAACSSDDTDTDRASVEESSTTTEGADDGDRSDDGDGSGDDPGATTSEPDDASGSDDDATTDPGDDEPATPTTAPSQGGDEGPPADLTSEAVCDRVPENAVAGALGVGTVTAEPAGGVGTPQCSYGFETSSGSSNATVAALRAEGDLDGRSGREAFEYTVDLNRRAAGSAELTETTLDVGDQAVLLQGGQLHFGVIRYGGRIVTVLVNAQGADADAAAALAGTTGPLAP